MNYKYILALLLFPIACLGSSLQELKEQGYQKLLEIQRIHTSIIQSHKNLQEVGDLYRNHFLEAREALRNKPENASKSDEELRQLIIKDAMDARDKVIALLSGSNDIDISIAELCYNNTKGGLNFGTFIEIQALFEYEIMKEMLGKYETRIQELIMIEDQIKRIEQNNEN